MEMTKIKEKKWVYTLYQSNRGIILSVLCGGVGMYELDILLTEEESIKAQNDDNFLEMLATDVRENPSSFERRKVEKTD